MTVDLLSDIDIVQLEDFSDQGVAVGMGPRGRDANDAVARLHLAAVDQAFFFHNSNAESGHIEVTVLVDAWHFRRLPADECRPGQLTAHGDSLDDLRCLIRIEMAAGIVIEKEQWFRSLDQEIIDAHRHEIDTDGVVLIGRDGQPQLGTNAIRSGNQNRMPVAPKWQFEQSAETAQPAHNFAAPGHLGERFDLFNETVAGINIDAGLLITDCGHCKPDCA